MADTLEELRKLPPDARIKKLKELAEQRKKEIEEAQNLMKISEDEIDQVKKLEEKIPIPQMISENMGTLTTGEEREIFETHHFVGRKMRDTKKERRPVEKREEKIGELEEVVEKEAEGKRLAPVTERAYGAIIELSRKPVEYFNGVFQELNQKAYDAGGIVKLQKEDRMRLEYANAGWDKKLEEISAGRYEPSKKGFKETVLTERLRDKLQSMYHSQADSGERTPGQEHEFQGSGEQEKKYFS